jgi:hypothetical protein
MDMTTDPDVREPGIAPFVARRLERLLKPMSRWRTVM